MYTGALNFGSSGGFNAILSGMSNLLNGAEDAMLNNLQTMETQNGGMLDAGQMVELQIYSQNYLAFIQTITSLVKQFGDIDKTVATNVGS